MIWRARKPPQPVAVPELQAIRTIKAEWRLLYNYESLQEHFDSPPQRGIHIVVQLLSHREHTFDPFFLAIYLIHSWETYLLLAIGRWSCCQEGAGTGRHCVGHVQLSSKYFDSDMFRAPCERKWALNEAIRRVGIPEGYYVDFRSKMWPNGVCMRLMNLDLCCSRDLERLENQRSWTCLSTN